MAFRSFFKSFLPTVRAQDEEEELVDPQTALREKCGEQPQIKALFEKLQACNDRVNSRSKTAETCLEEQWDFWAELDKCVVKTLWSKLK